MFAGSWDPRPGSYYSVFGSWVWGNGSRYSGSGSNETRHMKIRLDINLDPGPGTHMLRPIYPDPNTQTQIPRPIYWDPYIWTHVVYGPIYSDPNVQTQDPGPIFPDPYVRTQMFRPGTRDPYTQTHETEGNWRQPPVAASCPQFFNSFRSARCMYPAILITNFYLDINWTPFLLTGIIFLHHISSG